MPCGGAGTAARTKALLRASAIYLLHSMSHAASSRRRSFSTRKLRAESTPEHFWQALPSQHGPGQDQSLSAALLSRRCPPDRTRDTIAKTAAPAAHGPSERLDAFGASHACIRSMRDAATQLPVCKICCASFLGFAGSLPVWILWKMQDRRHRHRHKLAPGSAPAWACKASAMDCKTKRKGCRTAADFAYTGAGSVREGARPCSDS